MVVGATAIMEVVAVEVDEVEDVAGIGPPIDAVPDIIIIIPTAAVAAGIDAMTIIDRRRLLPADGDMAMADMAIVAAADAAEDGRAVPGPHDNRPIGSRPKR